MTQRKRAMRAAVATALLAPLTLTAQIAAPPSTIGPAGTPNTAGISLDVVDAEPTIRLRDLLPTGGANNPKSYWTNPTTNPTATSRSLLATAQDVILSSTVYSQDLIFTVQNPLGVMRFGTSGSGETERMTILADGKVGIGLNNPEFTSHVHMFGTKNLENVIIQTSQVASLQPQTSPTSRLTFASGPRSASSEFWPGWIQGLDDYAYGAPDQYTGKLEFYTNGNGSAERFMGVRAMTMINGDVAVGDHRPLARLHVNGGAVLADGTTGATPVSGTGTRMMFIPEKGAFRAGRVENEGNSENTWWDDANVGLYSFAAGYNVKASGAHASIALGHRSISSGTDAVALGYENEASGDYAFVAGTSSVASSSMAVSLGYRNAVGPNSAQGIAIGMDLSLTNANNAVVIGEGVSGTSKLSHSIPSSFAVGFASTIPTLYVGPGSGVATLGNVGVGTTTPVNRLDVEGGLAVGATYSGTQTVPSNGMLVEGAVAIGTTSPGAYKLKVNGDSWGTTDWQFSDARFKTNIEPVVGALDLIRALRGVYYDFTDGETYGLHLPDAHQIGFLAQELEKVVPEVVKTDDDGLKAVNYQNLTALLVEAMKEQDQTIAELRQQVSELRAMVLGETVVKRQEAPVAERLTAPAAVRFQQNQPNPFSNETTIHYHIPESVVTAQLVVFDMTAKEMARIALPSRGAGQVVVDARNWQSGVYQYTILADGMWSDGKQMIVQR